MLGKARSCFTKSTHYVYHSWRKTCLVEQLTQHQGCERRLLGRLQNYCTTSSKSRSNFPGHHEKRIIPRNNLSNNSDWLFFCHPKEGFRHCESMPFNFISLASKVAVSLSCPWNIFVLRDFQRFAIVEGFKVSKPLGISIKQISKFIDHFGPLISTNFSPFALIEGIPCGLDSQIDVGLGGGDGLSNDLFVGGVDDIKVFASIGVDELAVDEEFGLNWEKLFLVLHCIQVELDSNVTHQKKEKSYLWRIKFIMLTCPRYYIKLLIHPVCLAHRTHRALILPNQQLLIP